MSGSRAREFGLWDVGNGEVRRARYRLSPPQMFVGSFLLLIAAGTLGFKLLPGLYTGEPLGWVDACFTATSAICVTGLIVADTGVDFTFWGQLYLLVLIQLGGLGVIAFSSMIIMALGGRLSLTQEELSTGPSEVAPEVDRGRLIFNVVRFTFAIEAAGALLLYFSWLWTPGLGPGGAIWPSVFHSVSAFCNAGFSTFSASLVPVQRNPFCLAVVMALVVVGGLGFLTIEELHQAWVRWREKRRPRGTPADVQQAYLDWNAGGRSPPAELVGFFPHLREVRGDKAVWDARDLYQAYSDWRDQRDRKRLRLSLHSRLVLTVTAVLVLAAWPVFCLAEWNNVLTLGDLPAGHKLVNGLFMSVTPRTAGFNTIDYARATETTCFLTILLMVVGGSPGSTAGGIKTTTFALLAVVAWCRFRGRHATSLWGRSLREEIINRTVGLVVLAFAVTIGGVLLLTLTEFAPANRQFFLDHCFEVASAFNTVGLSMGVTGPDSLLSAPGRWLLIVLMFLGRVGPLTFAAAMASRYARAVRYRYAYEDVVVG